MVQLRVALRYQDTYLCIPEMRCNVIRGMPQLKREYLVHLIYGIGKLLRVNRHVYKI